MGLTKGSWHWPNLDAPTVFEVGKRLAESMHLDVETATEAFHVPALKWSFIEVTHATGKIDIHSGIPPNPFAWIHLIEAMDQLGGKRVCHPEWKKPTISELKRPWQDLRSVRRLVLSHSSLWPFWPRAQ
jgi:hypothetical protein